MSQKNKTRFIVPNFFTGANFLLGIFSALIASKYFAVPAEESKILFGKPALIMSAWMIIWGVCFDKLDGFAAKLMNASSEFGAQFDSLADLVAFGLAPAFLVFFYMHSISPEWSSTHFSLLIISVAIYVLCTAMRLARYNAKDSNELSGVFQGLPSTPSGGAVALSVILFDKYQIIEHSHIALFFLPILLITLGILMVSPFYLPQIGKRKKQWINIVQIPALILGYVFSLGMIFPEYLYVCLILYVVIGFSYYLINRDTIDIQASKD
jgi:CDP-diacylglycerol--serine O-phosphatidyltransferase